MLHSDFNQLLEDAINIQVKIDEYHKYKSDNSMVLYIAHATDIISEYFDNGYYQGAYFSAIPTIKFKNRKDSYINVLPESYSFIPRSDAHRFDFGEIFLIYYPNTMSYLCTENDISGQHYFKADKDMREILHLEYNMFKG